MSRSRKTPALIAALALALAACGDDDEDENPGAQFTLTFVGRSGQSGGFDGTHAGEQIRVAVIRTDNGAVVARAAGSVSVFGVDPAFSFTFPRVLASGVAYHVDYWIDHVPNGVCEPPPPPRQPGDPIPNPEPDTDSFDHQWREELPLATADLTREVDHHTVYADVCSTTRS